MNVEKTSQTVNQTAIPESPVTTAAATGSTWLAPPWGGWGLVPNQTPRGFWTALGHAKNLQMGRQGGGQAPLTIGWGFWFYKRFFNQRLIPGTVFTALIKDVDFIRKLQSGGNMAAFATLELREDLGGGRLGPPIVNQRRLTTGQNTLLAVVVPKFAKYRLTVGTSLRGAYQNYESPYGEIFATIASVTASAPVSLTEPAKHAADGEELVLEVEDFEAVQEFQEVLGAADPEAVELGSDRELAAAASN
jgi:hypothetical protein